MPKTAAMAPVCMAVGAAGGMYNGMTHRMTYDVSGAMRVAAMSLGSACHGNHA